MKRAVRLAIPALVFAFAASAQETPQAPPPANTPAGMATESVIVTAPKDRPEKQLDNFIIAHAAPSPYLRKIARWKTGICPLTVGLPPKFNFYVNQRIIRVAMDAGAPLDSKEPCRPNIIVAATPQPQEVLDLIREKRPALLGYHYTSREKELATMTRAVQAWYSTVTEDFYGFVEPDGGGYNMNTWITSRAWAFFPCMSAAAASATG